ncbi:hypothetical protein [Zoogloea sp.]|uniref:hypothetical protein n=1 Tax=Zoogloea sp. TaxID=49181 RepID=UPI0014164190|nr:MAG: hypothetical protein F9K15_10705 [Zoogloea sp.]
MNARNLILWMICTLPACSFAAEGENPVREMAKRRFWEDRTVSQYGYFVITKGYAETRVIEGLRKALESTPKNRRFDCASNLIGVDRGFSEEHDQDSFFFRTSADRRVMLSVFDLASAGDVYRTEEAYNVKVNGERATLAMVVDRENKNNSRWGVGWYSSGLSFSLTVENDGRSIIEKDWVIKLAESIQCKKIKNKI